MIQFVKKLEDVNENREPLISKIEWGDVALFKRLFSRTGEPAGYGDSISYITQACRGLGLGKKYCVGDTLLPIGFHNGHYVVVRPLGQFTGHTIKILNRLVALSGKPVFLKKITSDQRSELNMKADVELASHYDPVSRAATPGSYPWDFEAYADDDTYPELIIDIDITLAYELPLCRWIKVFREANSENLKREDYLSVRRSFKQFRRRIRRFRESGDQIRIEPFHAVLSNSVMKFIIEYFAENKDDNQSAYKNILELYSLYGKEHGFYSYVIYLEGSDKPVGFFAIEKLGGETAGLYAGLISRRTQGLPEYARSRVFEQLRLEGIRFLNLGGAEVKSLDQYKRHFAPIVERLAPMIVYGL